MLVRIVRTSLLLSLTAVLCATSLVHAEQWTQPTAEELALTSVPEAPGASAIYLLREQSTEDKLHLFSVHVRIKVLTAGAEDRGDVEIRYLQGGTSGFQIDELSGRTIHPDGTVIPFTGKPYDKLINKTSGHKYMARIFSLPDVTPGSILEYRYKLHYDDRVFISPDWYVQDDLFTRHVHYLWRPTDKMLITDDERGQVISTISWTPLLPPGASVQQSRDASGQLNFELNADNIPAIVTEEYAPPLGSFSYRVLFYMTPYRTHEEFWAKEGKYWAKKEDKFIGPGPVVKAAAAQLTSPADSPDEKLRKLYNAVQKLENTDNTREHSTPEDKAEGLRVVHTTDDVWTRRRGSGDQLADLFVALARADGFKAYAMRVTRRDRSFFFEHYLSLSQLDDTLAIVNVDGKDETFDPGTHFCPIHELAWQHQGAQGLRQVDGGSSIAGTATAPYMLSHVTRIADLALDEHGVASGTVVLTYKGAPALRWRQKYASEDEAAVRHDMTRELQADLVGGLNVSLLTLTALDAPDQPLVATFRIEGPIGSAAGKRLLLPAAFFEASERPMFPHEKRELAIAFPYTYSYQDAVRYKLPPTLVVESSVPEASVRLQKFAQLTMNSQTTPNSITVRRNEAFAENLFAATDYASIRKFRQDVESADRETIVLKSAQAPDAASTTAAATGQKQ